MIKVQRLVLDILKPHHPNALEFASALAEISPGVRIKLTVIAVDEKTETVEIELENAHIEFEPVAARIRELGATIHSIDEVHVAGEAADAG